MNTVSRLVLALLLFVITIVFNIVLIDLRFDEIRYLLGTIAATDEASNTLGIVTRYELIKRRMISGKETVDNYELEARMQALSSNELVQHDNSPLKSKKIQLPVKFVINAIRYALGKKVINPKNDDKIFNVIEIAYFWERVRKYTEALKIYDDVLSTAHLTPAIRAAVMVHKAFCYSMIGKYQQSKETYEDVITSFPTTDAGILSWKLLDFLVGMESKRQNLEKKQLTEMNKAKQFYLLMDFRNAIKSYSVFIAEKHSAIETAEARFYKGRSHEELGETDEALLEYRAVIRIDTTRIWAKQANRRMLMLGEFYEQQKSVSEEARRKLDLYQDQFFADNVNKYKVLMTDNSLKMELSKKPDMSASSFSNDSILDMIDKIGTLNLAGSKTDNVQQPENHERMSRELMDSHTLSAAEMTELNRRQYLADNPFRRPAAIKQSIDEYSGELRYVYNKRLRTGIKLSGKMLVKIAIKADGSVAQATLLQSSMGDAVFEKTIRDKIAKWKFNPVPDSLGEMTVNYPFEFYEEE